MDLTGIFARSDPPRTERARTILDQRKRVGLVFGWRQEANAKNPINSQNAKYQSAFPRKQGA
jgi:hypothetical protein